MIYFKRTALATSVSILLAACGGGGSSSTPAAVSSTSPVTPGVPTVPTTPAVPVVTPAYLQTSVPAFTYGANSQELAFATALNQFRQQIGLGLVAQNAKLDTSATSHLGYVVANDSAYGGTVSLDAIDPASGLPYFHVEQAGKTGFTGVLPADRDKVAGYSGQISSAEEGGFGGGQGSTLALTTLIATVYHR